jgi:prolyl-tRNA editing enzyme YbaK/EbsC (Cys-tRNA(Pro) deacylase)
MADTLLAVPRYGRGMTTTRGAEGTLAWRPAARHTELLASPVVAALAHAPGAQVAAIDPTLADTAAFCEAYESDPRHSANCVVVAGRRAGEVWYAAVLVLASMRADINGVVRRHLDVRKISFAPQEYAVALTGMEFGGITPIGLPDGWPVLVDEAVVAAGTVVIGSGIRGSKLLVDAAQLAALPSAEVLELAR